MTGLAVMFGEDLLMCRVGMELQGKGELCEAETGSLQGWWQGDEDSAQRLSPQCEVLCALATARLTRACSEFGFVSLSCLRL